MFRMTTVALTLVVSVLGGSAVAEAKVGGVRSLADPPAKAAQQFMLRITGSAARVTLYAGYLRRQGRGDVKLGTVAVRGHNVKVTLPQRLAPGAYFIIACPASGRGSCAASRKATLLLPKASSVLRKARRYATRSTRLRLRVVAQPGGARTYTIRVR